MNFESFSFGLTRETGQARLKRFVWAELSSVNKLTDEEERK